MSKQFINNIKRLLKINDRQSAKNISFEEQNIIKMQSYHNKFKKERCFIIGNGPSLNKIDLTLLKDEYTFGVNGIFYKYDEMGFKTTFYVVEDSHVVNDNLERINAIDYSQNFFPHFYNNMIKRDADTTFMNADFGFYQTKETYYRVPRFSFDCSEVIYAGQSVTYLNLQLAYYFGFQNVYLIGMDFSYAVPESSEISKDTIISNEDDPNHFHPDYFGKGKKWHDPKLDNCKMVYEYAKKIYEEKGRNIYNASIGGKLEVFERIDFNRLFDKRRNSLWMPKS